MAREDVIVCQGTIVQVLKQGLWTVELSNGHRLIAHGTDSRLGMVPGDQVWIEISPFDLSRGAVRKA